MSTFSEFGFFQALRSAKGFIGIEWILSFSLSKKAAFVLSKLALVITAMRVRLICTLEDSIKGPLALSTG